MLSIDSSYESVLRLSVTYAQHSFTRQAVVPLVGVSTAGLLAGISGARVRTWGQDPASDTSNCLLGRDFARSLLHGMSHLDLGPQP